MIWKAVALVDNNLISDKTEALRTEIELIQLQERFYRRSNDRSIAARKAHDRRQLRLLEMRAELLTLQRHTP